MFCPKCGSEYVEGIKECSDCRLPLVEELPVQKRQRVFEYVELVTVLCTGDANIIAVAKSILQSTGIKYYAKNEISYSSVPLFNSGPFEIQVDKRDEEDARTLLKELM